MSPRDSVTSPPKKKSTRDRNNPVPDKERTQAYQARMRETHKVLRVYIKSELKEALVDLCKGEGVSQAELLEQLIQQEIVRKKTL